MQRTHLAPECLVNLNAAGLGPPGPEWLPRPPAVPSALACQPQETERLWAWSRAATTGHHAGYWAPLAFWKHLAVSLTSHVENKFLFIGHASSYQFISLQDCFLYSALCWVFGGQILILKMVPVFQELIMYWGEQKKLQGMQKRWWWCLAGRAQCSRGVS